MSVILPDIIITKIYNDYVFDLPELRSALFLSKKYNKELHTLFEKYKKAIQIKYNFPQHIIEMGGKLQQFLKYKMIPFKKKYMGGTAYLDKFTTKDISDSIMIGIDSYRRPFITLKLKYQANLDKIPIISREFYTDEFHSGIVTIFQRYTDSSLSWTTASCYSKMMDLFQTGMLTDNSLNAIKELIANKYVEYNYRRIWII